MDFDSYLQSKGYAPGTRIPAAAARQLHAQFVKEGRQWEIKQDAQGNLIRANPETGLVLAMTNEQGQPVKGSSANPFADYAGPAACGVAGAAVDTNSMAFQGVQPAAAPQANPVVPVNMNPAAPTAAPTPAPAPTAAPAPSPAYRSEDDVIAAARAKLISKEQAQQILVNQFGLDP